MRLATPDRIQTLQRKLYLKAKRGSQTSGGESRGVPIPSILHLRDAWYRKSQPSTCEVAHALRKNLVREPDAGNPHVRFDEREVETEHGRDTEAPTTERVGNR